MLEQYIAQAAQLEQEWYSRDPGDDVVTKKLVNWLDKDKAINVIVLKDTLTIKNFVRAYRAAFEEIVNKKIDLEAIEVKLEKENKQRVKNGKKSISRIQYINYLLKNDVLKHDLCIRVGDVDLDITALPSTAHLGNGHVRNIGKYCDIWPILNLITDCEIQNNQKLAELFLEFANGPSKFTREKLIEINPKFAGADFNTSVDYFCNFLTGIAMHYVFYEPARRVILTENEARFNAEAPNDIPVASSIIIVLKALRDGILTKLEDAFSPESKYILITKEGVRSLSKAKSQSVVKELAVIGRDRVVQEYGKKQLSPNEMVAHLLYPNSDTFDSAETEKYPGKKVNIFSGRKKGK